MCVILQLRLSINISFSPKKKENQLHLKQLIFFLRGFE